MRWEDERYVRVYVRDTAEWLALGWEAQALLVLLLRKADRAGIIQTGKTGARGLAALVGMPLDVAQRAVTSLLDDGCLQEMAGGYMFPNFLAAQEARSTDAQRKREQRARDREKALAGGASGSVTGMDAEARMSRAAGQMSVTQSHHGVTPCGHAASDNVTVSVTTVTPSRAVPYRAQETTLSADADEPPGEALPDATDDAQPVLLEVPSMPAETPAALQALWNAEAHPSLPRWQGMSDTRKRRAQARLRERPLSVWRDVIRRLSASPFCRGEEGGTGWRASPDWLLQPDTAEKVLEGKYDRAERASAMATTPKGSPDDQRARDLRDAIAAARAKQAAGGAA